MERVFGDRGNATLSDPHAELPENCQPDYDRQIRNAYATTNYVDAKEALGKIIRQLDQSERGAKPGKKGLEVTLTAHSPSGGRVVAAHSGNHKHIESCLSTVGRVAQNVDRWRGGD